MTTAIGWSAAAALILISAAPVAAKKVDAAKVLDSLQECQAIGDPGQRLACFDERIVTLKEARSEDREFLSRREKVEFKPIASTATAVTELQPGTWLLVLADHSVWRTNDDVRFYPKVGQPVRVTKGIVGNFLANIGNERAVRVLPLR